ncbi:MAG: DegT/DnrJ/EryC1/StrS family aminotransferase [Solirubrobacterales bacterium]
MADKLRAPDAVVAGYRRRLGDSALASRVLAPPEIGASYLLWVCESLAEAERVRDSLTRSGIGHRLWYGGGLHRQAAYRDLPRDPLAVTDDLAPRVLGVPLAPDLSDKAIARVVDALAA